MNNSFLQGNWIDLIIVFFILFYIFDRWGRGFLEGLVDLSGFILSLLFALKFYSSASIFLMHYFALPIGVANALGFLFVAIAFEFLFNMIAFYILSFIDKKVIHSRLNLAFGVIPSLVSGMILASFILTAFLVLPVRPDIKQYIAKSRIGGYLTERTLGTERYISQIFGDAIQETLTFMTVKPEGDESINLNFSTEEFSVDQQAEQEMFSLVNKERRGAGFSSLREDEDLLAVARSHCEDMFRRGYFSHYNPDGLSPFDRMNAYGIHYLAAGENLAYAPTVEIAHTGLMNSPGHRANILSPDFGRVGIGVINAGIYGRMFCQEFTN